MDTTRSLIIAELVPLITAKALRRGSFRLASGREASFYLDAKQVVLDARGSMLVGRAILDLLVQTRPGIAYIYLIQIRNHPKAAEL